jgi:ParB-like chromosome segregation protein Spo0J
MIILGGNMRYKAAKEIGLKEIPIIITDLSEDKQREFLIKDNTSGGEWDWEVLANEWDSEELSEWGLDIPNWAAGMDENNMTDEDVDIEEEFDPAGISKDLHKLVLIFDSEEHKLSFVNKNELLVTKHAQNTWKSDLSTQYI